MLHLSRVHTLSRQEGLYILLGECIIHGISIILIFNGERWINLKLDNVLTLY